MTDHKRCFVDLTGQTFGRWYVLGVDLDRTGTLTWFRCQCSCGGVKSVVAKSLSNGASKSCGCFAREVSGRPRPYREYPSRVKNLTNRRFGRLVVRSIVDRNRLGVRWSCDCDCGKTKLVRGSYLINGTVKSCGCLADESRVANGKANAEDLSNRIFGLLTVLRPTDKRTPYPTEYIIWDCMCECGNRCEIASKDLKNGTKSCGCVRPHVFIGSVRATKAEFPHLSTDLINGISIARARFCQQIGPTMTKTLRRYIRNANKREERTRSK